MVIGIDDLFPEILIVQDAFDLTDKLCGNETVHHREEKTLGFDILDEDGISVDHDRNTKIKSFKEGVPKAFIGAEIGDEVSVSVGIPQCVCLPSLIISLADIRDSIRYNAHIHFLFFGKIF